jgi:hypothetical protein
MSTYIPPHKRNQTKTPATTKNSTKPTPELHEKDFVPLSLNEPKTAPKVDWKSVNFEDTRSAEVHFPPPPSTSIPIRRQPERILENDQYSENSDDSNIDEIEHTGPVGDGWTVVEKKVRVKRDKVQEALDNGDAPLSDEDEEQSYWDEQPEEYETYWDRKP